jgi:hypothetical protein
MLDQFTPCQLDRLSESQSRNEHDKKQQNRDEKIEVNTDGKLERGSIEPTVYNGSLPRIESVADQGGGETRLYLGVVDEAAEGFALGQLGFGSGELR